jgi:NADPH2:quinone reductase
MRAWTVRRHGDPAEVLELGDVPVPEPAGDQVLVAVAACALNFADDLLCRGSYQEHPPLPFTPGLEVAGEVVAAGPTATHPVGTRVAGSTLLPHGGLAERCLARSADVFPVPDGLDDVTAAAMHVTYQTAWFALHRRAGLRSGETLLVHAAAGGTGSAAVQLGVVAGATVVATAGGPDKVARCRELGAHLVVDHRTQDFVDAVLEFTDGRGADVVVDPVGGDTFTRSTRCIAWEGRLLVLGAASGSWAPARTNHVMVKNYSVVGVHWGGYRTRHPELVAAAHDELTALALEGRIAPLVSRRVPLDRARDALADLTAGGTTGKLVVVP